MTDLTTLRDLKQRVENATGPDEALDAAICVALQYGSDEYKNATNFRVDPHDISWFLFEAGGEERCGQPPAITASIDASLAFVERVLPGWRPVIDASDPALVRVTLHNVGERAALRQSLCVYGKGATIQHAVISAALSALIAKEEATAKEPAHDTQ